MNEVDKKFVNFMLGSGFLGLAVAIITVTLSEAASNAITALAAIGQIGLVIGCVLMAIWLWYQS